jgi:hypothetical protein
MRQSVITCTAATRPASPNEGMLILETDTDKYLTYTGSDWVDLSARINGDWTSYTPTFSEITIGNGTVSASFMRVGKTIFYKGQIVYGSTTAYGNAAGNSIKVTLPTTPKAAGFAGHVSIARYTDASTGITYPCIVVISAAAQIIIQFGVTNVTANTVTASTFNNNFPVAEGVDDEIGWMFIYEEA